MKLDNEHIKQVLDKHQRIEEKRIENIEKNYLRGEELYNQTEKEKKERW